MMRRKQDKLIEFYMQHFASNSIVFLIELVIVTHPLPSFIKQVLQHL